jgi:aspartate kinase
MLIVQKFGGTSVADTEKIKNIVSFAERELAFNNQLVIVVSAMAGVTNHLITLCNEVSTLASCAKLQEYDTALATGEIVSAALVALTLQEKNISARSFAAWQVPLVTNNDAGQASVLDFDPTQIRECLNSGIIPVIAGFQGVGANGRITTLGRGGSDITAVLTAARLGAARCDIYTDVEGVYSSDPRIVHNAKLLKSVSYDQMLELAACGAKVLHPRAVEIAMRYNVNLRVLSSFSGNNGTSITKEVEIMEQKSITGIASNKNLLNVEVLCATTGINELCLTMLEHNIHINSIQTMARGNCSFISPISDKNKLELLLENLKQNGKIKEFKISPDIAIIAVIGYGIKSDAQVLHSILTKLKSADVTVKMIEVSEIKISILIDDKNTEKAVSALHELVE